jgi:hypothetical protein
MQKSSSLITAWQKLTPAMRTAIATITGAGTGAAMGTEVMPRLGGYYDVPSARHASGVLHGIVGGALGSYAGSKGLRAVAQEFGPLKTRMGLGAALIAEEALPMSFAAASRTAKATQDLARATESAAIPAAISKAVTSPIGQGAGIGAGVAGLGALATGLLRRKSEDEMNKRKTRAQMVTKDFLKYVIPAMLAGGVIGSFKSKV